MKDTVFILFGISGDLSRRKILPSLLHLFEKGLLDPSLRLIGVSRRDISLSSIFSDLGETFKDNIIDDFVKRCEIFTMDMSKQSEFDRLKLRLESMNKEQEIFYLSVPPESLLGLIEHLGNIKTNKTKILFEKPFGTDLTSAKSLMDKTHEYFTDEQTYHIDHYLAKQIVQDILKWKSLESTQLVLNSEHIRKIEILSIESLGVEGRANFYDATGALRDLIQSHLLEILAIIIKDQGENRSEALGKLIKDSIKARRGQYKGYKEEVVNINSSTETFAEITLSSSEEKWRGVPFTLVTGKAFAKKILEVNIITNDSIIKFDQNSERLSDNSLFDYEKLIFDAINGDRTLFLGNGEILATWCIIDPIISAWSKDNSDLFIYEKGQNIDTITQL